jgi:hypothetical protein
MRYHSFSVVSVAYLLLFSTAAQATTYKFRVTCPNRSYVDQWETGAIDPGKEYLRVASGKTPDCQVTDFNPARDTGLPVNRHSDAGGVIDGLPPVVILRKIFGF